jgi:hypothetical protein
MEQDQRRFEFRILHWSVACVSVSDAFVGKIVFECGQTAAIVTRHYRC